MRLPFREDMHHPEVNEGGVHLRILVDGIDAVGRRPAGGIILCRPEAVAQRRRPGFKGGRVFLLARQDAVQFFEFACQRGFPAGGAEE